MLPWDRRYAVAPANLYFHGEPYSHDFRRMLQHQVADAARSAIRMNMGVEPEVYVLRETATATGRHGSPRTSSTCPPAATTWRRRCSPIAFLEPMVDYMNELGWDVYSFDHEGGDGQYEFDFGYTDALAMADRMLIFRLMAKHVARTLGCFASFMPKPIQDSFGSGAHLNISLADIDTGRNLFDERRGRRDRNPRPARGKVPTARSPISSPPGCSAHGGGADGGAVADGELLQAADAARAHAGDLLGAGVPGLGLQQPDADVPAAR